MNWDHFLLLYLAGVNLIAFLAMGLDKRKAQQHERRIAEKALFLFPLLGGSIGGIAGIYLFRHKTKHWYFRLGFPLILAVQIALVFCALHFLR